MNFLPQRPFVLIMTVFLFMATCGLTKITPVDEKNPQEDRTTFSAKPVIKDLNKLCLESYQRDAVCPKDFCRLFCLEGEGAEQCTLSCEPRTCLELTIDHCPEDACQILDGCGENNKRCYPKMQEEPPVCGGLAYSGKLDCCAGFVKRCGIEFFDGSCDREAEFSLEGVPMCIPCGNGICNQFENKCNCPEDCQ